MCSHACLEQQAEVNAGKDPKLTPKCDVASRTPLQGKHAHVEGLGSPVSAADHLIPRRNDALERRRDIVDS